MSRCPQCGFDQGHNHKRSNPDHRRLFALIREAYQHWPETHPFEPQNAEHLRKWLIVTAGPEWRNARQTWLTNDEATRRIVKEAKKDSLDSFAIGDGTTLAMCSPKSIAFHEMSQDEFGRLRDAITDVIEQSIGCTVADLMQEAA
jgi:hypothetical protein